MSIVASLLFGCFLGRCWFLRFFGAIFCYDRALRVPPAVTRLTVYRGFAVKAFTNLLLSADDAKQKSEFHPRWVGAAPGGHDLKRQLSKFEFKCLKFII